MNYQLLYVRLLERALTTNSNTRRRVHTKQTNQIHGKILLNDREFHIACLLYTQMEIKQNPKLKELRLRERQEKFQDHFWPLIRLARTIDCPITIKYDKLSLQDKLDIKKSPELEKYYVENMNKEFNTWTETVRNMFNNQTLELIRENENAKQFGYGRNGPKQYLKWK